MLGRRAAAQVAALVFSFALPPAAHSGVIPLPAEVIPGSGSFSVDPRTIVRVPRGDRDADNAARYLVELWSRTNGLTLAIALDNASTAATRANTIAFRHRSGLGPEAYELDVTPQRITVSASAPAGLFYGAVTLWQLLPPGDHAGQIPAQTIRDAPIYRWRGLMLDSSR